MPTEIWQISVDLKRPKFFMPPRWLPNPSCYQHISILDLPVSSRFTELFMVLCWCSQVPEEMPLQLRKILQTAEASFSLDICPTCSLPPKDSSLSGAA